MNKEVEPRQGEKMIVLQVRFFTDDIAEGKGKIVPKHAWTNGTVNLRRNDSHGFSSSRSITFNSLMEIPGKIEEVILKEGIVLHTGSPMKKYVVNE